MGSKASTTAIAAGTALDGSEGVPTGSGSLHLGLSGGAHGEGLSLDTEAGPKTALSDLDSPLKITIITGPFFSLPPAPCGSVERLWFDLAKSFAAQGHQVTFVARSWKDAPERESLEGINIIRHGHFKASRLLFFSLLKDLIHAIRSACKAPTGDVLILNSVMLPFACSLFAKKAGRMYVNINRVPKGQFKLYRFLSRASFTAASKRIQELICMEAPDLKARCHVFHNPVNLNVFRPSENRNVEGQSILYCGRIHPEKGLGNLIRAFKIVHERHPAATLKIVGPYSIGDGGGGDEYLASLKEKAASLPVSFQDPVYDRHEYVKLLHSANYFVYPTIAEHGEALPVSPLEALATGLVPICSNLKVFDDYIIEGETGITFDFKAENSHELLADAFEKLMNDPQAHQRMSTNAICKAQEFGIASIASQYLEEFQRTVSESSSNKVSS